MLRQIVFIYRDPFVCSVVEKKAKEEGIQSYVTADLSENIAYVLDDLDPDFVIIDEAVLSADNSQIMASLEDSKCAFKSVLLSSDPEKAATFDHVIKLPFDPMELLDHLRTFLS